MSRSVVAFSVFVTFCVLALMTVAQASVGEIIGTILDEKSVV